MKKKNKKKRKLPRPRHVWTLNPKTRVKKSVKTYRRSREKQQAKKRVDQDLG